MTEQKKNKNTLLKKIGITLLVVITLLVIFTTFFLKGIVNRELKSQIKNTFGDFYTLSYESSATSLSPSGLSISYKEVKFVSDTSDLYMLTKYPAIFLKTESIEIIDINIFRLLLQSKVNTNRLLIDEPELSLFIPETMEPESEDESSKNNESVIQEILIKKVELIDGKAKLDFEKDKGDNIYASEKLNLYLEMLKVDLTSDASVLNSSTVEQIDLSMEELLINPENTDYTYEANRLIFNYQDDNLSLFDLSITPKNSAASIMAKYQHRKSAFNIQLDSMIYKSDDFEQLKKYQSINAQSLNVFGLDMEIDRDKSKPLDETVYKKLFQQSLLALPLEVQIDSVSINNSSINYRLHSSNERDPGNLLLTSLNAEIFNLNTIERKPVEARFTGSFMGETAFNFNFQLPLEANKRHSYNGQISSMNFSGLNPLISNLSRVKFNEGKIESIDFEGSGNDLVNTGRMTLKYHDMKFSVTDKANNRRWLQSGLGNLVVRSENKTDKNDNPEAIEYTYERPPFKDHLDLYAGGLIDGFTKGVLPKAIYEIIMNN